MFPIEFNAFLIAMGLRVSERRKTLHMTQEQLAEKVGVSLQTISNVELGKKAIRPENLASLCNHLEVTSDYILYGKRDDSQMSEIIEKLSCLSPEAYHAVSELIDLLVQN